MNITIFHGNGIRLVDNVREDTFTPFLKPTSIVRRVTTVGESATESTEGRMGIFFCIYTYFFSEIKGTISLYSRIDTKSSSIKRIPVAKKISRLDPMEEYL